MSLTRIVALALAMAATLTPPALAQSGPARGSLVIVGGGRVGDEIYDRFIDLAGGVDAPIVVIPTAGENDEEYNEFYGGLTGFRRAGAGKLTVLHTRDRNEANSEAFARTIREARGVWFEGGRQWRLADSYLNTRVHEELTALLARGGVIGGSSAGATILGDYLVRGDTRDNTTMMGDHTQGFAFLKGVGIDQHVLKRNRQFDMIEVIEAMPELLGIAIDESTAIVVQGDRFQVLGASYALIYDSRRMLDSGGQFYFLAPGDRYDLKTRQATRPSTAQEPIGRVIEKAWPR